MRRTLILLFALVAGALPAAPAPPDDNVLGYWPFERSLADASGHGRDAAGPADYAEGKQGAALRLVDECVEIPSSPDLQLAPGLTIDCWVYFERKPTGYPHVVYKDKEYQLRVDGEGEGGRFRFFVYLNGWEPRVGAVVPEANRWYHLVARWTGTEISLEIDGQRSASARSGVPVPTGNPVHIGYLNGRVDELRISNPRLAAFRRMEAAAARVPQERRSRRAAFGGVASWAGWTAAWGASMRPAAGALRWQASGGDGVLYHPGLDLDLAGRSVLTLDIQSPETRDANLVFLTDKGRGVVPFPIWPGRRASVVDVSASPLWAGRLRFLGIAFQDDRPHRAVLRRLWISSRAEGSPYLYLRSVAPGRAILRAGREERIVAVARSLGAEARGITARLVAPPGLRILDGDTRKAATLGNKAIQKLEWRVRAAAPVVGRVKVVLASAGMKPVASALDVRFRAPAKGPKASYVPRPVPAKTDYLTLMHYCPLWKAGTHYGWEKIEPWPERRPAIGWYDEGTPEVADWHIKYALEHGIQGFIYCWYRSDFSPDIHHFLGHAIHDGLLKARYRDRFKFTIMWENGCANGVKSREDMLENLLPYWIRTYFKHPSYVKIGNKPVLFVWRPERVAPELGGSEATREVFDAMREACRQAGFDGLHIVGCVDGADEALLRRMAREGWDASSAYGIAGGSTDTPGRDPDGASTTPYDIWLRGMQRTWLEKRAVGALPDIVDVMMGWDPRPWHGEQTSDYRVGVTPQRFREACRAAKRVVDATPGNGLDKRLVVFDNWNEFGEGHYLEPCAGYGFGFLDAIREVFCKDAGPHEDLVPEDVGLATPDRIYRRRREILTAARRSRQAPGPVVAWWRFEEKDDEFALDSSPCGFHGVKLDYRRAEGIRGNGFGCAGGSVSLAADPLFFPREGITVELWMKTDVPEQGDRWMVNTVGAANTGYRLGLLGGKVAWQIPLADWSHSVVCPNPAPLGQWVHVAATYDNRTMRVYVDGEEQASGERGGAIKPSAGNLCLGSYAAGNTPASFQGVLDEVKIHRRALSPEEIRAAARRPWLAAPAGRERRRTRILTGR